MQLHIPTTKALTRGRYGIVTQDWSHAALTVTKRTIQYLIGCLGPYIITEQQPYTVIQNMQSVCTYMGIAKESGADRPFFSRGYWARENNFIRKLYDKH